MREQNHDRRFPAIRSRPRPAGTSGTTTTLPWPGTASAVTSGIDGPVTSGCCCWWPWSAGCRWPAWPGPAPPSPHFPPSSGRPTRRTSTSTTAPTTRPCSRRRPLPGVTSLQSYVALNIAPVHPNGTPDMTEPGRQPRGGRHPPSPLRRPGQDHRRRGTDAGSEEPRRSGDLKFAASVAGLHVGAPHPRGDLFNSQLNGAGMPTGPANQRLTFDVVGIGIFNDEVVQDDVDRIPRM